ncbi:MAG TPA: glycosyltransferase [Gammaproteobacteria bacterium]
MALRIVINCWGSHGDVFPYVGLAKALAARGHTPVVAAPESYRRIVEQEDIRFTAVGPDVDSTDTAMMVRALHPSRGSEFIVRELMLPHLRKAYEELRSAARGADLLVSHPVTYAAPVLAEREGLPWVSTVLAPMLFFSVTDLPAFPNAPWLVHAGKLGPSVARAIVNLSRRATRGWMLPVQRLRADLGLPPGRHPLFEGLFSPLLTLALFSKVLAEPQPDWPPNVAVTGFSFYNGPDGLPPALEEFLASGRPPVVFTLGTSAVGAAGRFYHESVAAAARLGVRAVLLIGNFERNRPAGALPRDVLVAERAPHELLFPRASAIVHHGGVGTTGQALRSGRPMLVVPHSHDQPDNALRVRRLGVARTLPPRQYRAERVARELERLLEESYRARAEATAAIVRGEGGADAAAEAIERISRAEHGSPSARGTPALT